MKPTLAVSVSLFSFNFDISCFLFLCLFFISLPKIWPDIFSLRPEGLHRKVSQYIRYETVLQNATFSTKNKCHLEEKEYKKLYPTGSRPGLFYGTAKAHNLKIGEWSKELTIRPIISNIGTTTYEAAKYLNTLLTPLTKSQYNILSADDSIQKIKSERIAKEFQIISFDVKKTIEIILSKVYQENKIKTSVPKNILRELLYLCTKEVQSIFNDEIYIQSEGVAMRYPLGPWPANTFMASIVE